jgi:hypothetical protein
MCVESRVVAIAQAPGGFSVCVGVLRNGCNLFTVVEYGFCIGIGGVDVDNAVLESVGARVSHTILTADR